MSSIWCPQHAVGCSCAHQGVTVKAGFITAKQWTPAIYKAPFTSPRITKPPILSHRSGSPGLLILTILKSSSVSASLKVLQVSKSLAKPTRPVMSRAMRIVMLFMSSAVPAGSCDMFLMTLASV